MAAEPYTYAPIRGPRVGPWYDLNASGPVHAYSMPYEAERRMRAVEKYIGLGWRVHPLHNPEGHGCSCAKGDTCHEGKTRTGKHPRLGKWQHLASSDPAPCQEWWEQWPLANIGILTGREGGLLVIDIDPDNGGSLEALDDLIGGHIPQTPMVESGRGGCHLYFQYPNGYDISSSAEKLAPGIDVRSNGAYVVAPPSRHETGNDYLWKVDLATTPLAEVPPALLRKLVKFPESGNSETPQDRQSSPTVESHSSAPYWLEWALEQTTDGTGDHVGYLLAQQLLCNCADDPMPTLLAYAREATRNRADPFTERDATRWLESARHSDLVARGEPAHKMDGQAGEASATSGDATTPPLRDESVSRALERVTQDCLSVSLSMKTVPTWAEVEQDWDIQAIQDPNRRNIASVMRQADCLPSDGVVTYRGSNARNRRQAHKQILLVAWAYLFPGQPLLSHTQMSEALNAVEQGEEGWLLLDLLYGAFDTPHDEKLYAPCAWFMAVVRRAVGRPQPPPQRRRKRSKRKPEQDAND